MARILILAGIILILAGSLVYLAGRIGLTWGRLPGNIQLQIGNLTCFFPIGISILLSILLTLALNIIVRLLNK